MTIIVYMLLILDMASLGSLSAPPTLTCEQQEAPQHSEPISPGHKLRKLQLSLAGFRNVV